MNSISFQSFLVQAFKLSYAVGNSVCFCYTYYEMTDQLL